MSDPRGSLERRALAQLARREMSRAELKARLLPHADSERQVEALLDELAARGLLSDERFTEVWLAAKADRFGRARLEAELVRRGVAREVIASRLDALEASEISRARRVWARRFGAPPRDARARARQIRFLQGRGFSSDAIRVVLREAEKKAADE